MLVNESRNSLVCLSTLMKEEMRMFGHDENLHLCTLMITCELEGKRKNKS